MRFVWDIIDGKQWVQDIKTNEWLGPFESAAEARQAIKVTHSNAKSWVTEPPRVHGGKRK